MFKNKLYEFTNLELLQTVLTHTYLDVYNSDHGINHWHRVFLNTLELAEHYKIQSPIFELFSIFHDSQRENEYRDDYHGKRGATLAQKLYPSYQSYCSNDELDKLIFACIYHTKPNLSHQYSNDLIVRICWDADKLDIDRVGIIPDKKYFFTDYAKKIIEKRGFYEI